jgi:hypothetical protein
MLTLSLPPAPSVNAAWINRKAGTGRGRIRSAKLRDWVRRADAMYMLQGLGRMAPIKGFYSVKITMPWDMKGDEDNRVKVVLDWLVSRKLTPDDRFMRGHQVKRDPELHNLFWITVSEVDGA